MGLAQTAGCAVVVDHSIFAQHQAVPRPTDWKFQKRVAIDPVEEFCGVVAENLDLAKRGDIADAGILTNIQHFAIDAFPPGRFARFREPGGTVPEAGFDKDRTILLGSVMQR